ncbi:MAG: hypothetical protein GY726_16685 [Proteobacteria bacterium]|nr:hypothetical protein [Pseudomonadota bacterium]
MFKFFLLVVAAGDLWLLAIGLWQASETSGIRNLNMFKPFMLICQYISIIPIIPVGQHGSMAIA